MKAERVTEGGKACVRIKSPSDNTEIVYDPDTDDYEAIASDPADVPEPKTVAPVESQARDNPPRIEPPVEPVHIEPVDVEPVDGDDSWISWK